MGPNIVLPPGVKITLKKKTEDESDFGIDELSLDDKPVTEQNDGQFCFLFFFFSNFPFIIIIFFYK